MEGNEEKMIGIKRKIIEFFYTESVNNNLQDINIMKILQSAERFETITFYKKYPILYASIMRDTAKRIFDFLGIPSVFMDVNEFIRKKDSIETGTVVMLYLGFTNFYSDDVALKLANDLSDSRLHFLLMVSRCSCNEMQYPLTHVNAFNRKFRELQKGIAVI